MGRTTVICRASEATDYHGIMTTSPPKSNDMMTDFIRGFKTPNNYLPLLQNFFACMEDLKDVGEKDVCNNRVN